MLRSMTLGKRIALGIFIMLVLMVVVGVAGYFGLTQILHVTYFYRGINSFQSTVASVKGQTDQYLLATYSGETSLQQKAQKATFSNLKKAFNEVSKMKEHPTVDESGSQKFTQAEKGINQYKGMFGEYINSQKTKVTTGDKITGIYNEMIKSIDGGKVFWSEKIAVQGKVFFSDYVKYVSVTNDNNLQKLKEGTASFKKAVDDWAVQVESSEELNPLGKKLATLYETLNKSLDNYSAVVARQIKLGGSMENQIRTLLNICDELGRISLEKLQAQSGLSLKIIFVCMLAALLIGTFYAFISIRTIVGIIKTAISGINNGSGRVAEAANQVSTASQSLAEGSSEQAASIEETSSSLEEMSSMTKQNADHANEAKSMMAEASQVVDKVNIHMNDMAEAIEEINKSSEETSKIIKTIDEIAFQTNLLALNAAVEAARAGEAGAGFAVVADEVRNLAMRAAEAAKNTANLIENTIKTVKNGNDLTKLTREAFNENMEISKKVSELVEEIAAASNEQAEGIGQVNMAVAEMDKVVQQNAASAEESASAAEEMNASAIQLNDIVNDMKALVGGNISDGKKNFMESQENDNESTIKKLQGLIRKPDNKDLSVQKPNEISPDQVIKVDNNEAFQDF